jgi:hypothetical protein
MSERTARLPIAKVVALTFADASKHFQNFALLSIVCAALSAPILLSPNYLLFYGAQFLGGSVLSQTLGLGLALLPYFVVLVVGFIAAVRWHRLVLLGEPINLGFLPRWRALRTYGLLAFLVYGGFALYVWGVFRLPHVFALISPNNQKPVGFFEMVAVLVIGLGIGCVILGRFALAFAAAAVEDKSTTLRAAWVATRGSTWRMLVAWMLCIAPIYLIGEISRLSGLLQVVPLPITLFVNLSMQFAAALLTAGFVSVAYRHFSGVKREERVASL